MATPGPGGGILPTTNPGHPLPRTASHRNLTGVEPFVLPSAGLGLALVTATLPAAWRQRFAAVLAVLAGALALTATLNRSQEYMAAGWWPWDVWHAATVGPVWPAAQREQLNLLLLLPVTYFATLALRRPPAVVVAGVAFSYAIEYAQGATGIGTAQLADVVHNTAGAVVGTAAAAVLLSAVDRRSRRRPSTAPRRED